MVFFSYLNIFKTVDLKSLSIKSGSGFPQGQFLLISFFSVNGPYILVFFDMPYIYILKTGHFNIIMWKLWKTDSSLPFQQIGFVVAFFGCCCLFV